MTSSAELIKQLRSLGWVLDRSRGSHHQFRHPDFGYTLTVPHPKKDLPTGTLKAILRAAKGKP